MLIDTFLMSDASESDLLWVKLNLEASTVDYFIIQENEFNLKGEYKGLHVAKILEEERFKEFLPKIIHLAGNFQLNVGYTDEHNNFVREKTQRTMCYDKLIELKPDYVLISDVDESIDFTNESRKQRFFSSVNSDYVSWVKRRRYWYDYDNEAKLYSIRIPIIPGKLIPDRPDILAGARHYHDENRTFGSYDDAIAYEYSYVFKSEVDVNNKKKNYAHNGFTEECVKNALKLNVWPRSKIRGEKIRWGGEDEFETIELNELNSPQFVRDNLTLLKTNLVDINYKENRKNWTSEYTE